MKMLSFRGIGFGAVLIGLSFVGVARLEAQATTHAAPPSMLDPDEMAQLNKARATVFAAHPDLKAENEKLKALHEATTTPTAAQRDATFAEWKDYQKKMRAEMLKIDPGLAPVFAKIDAARKNGAPPPFQPAPAK